MNERKQSIINDFIGDLIGPVRFRKYYLRGDAKKNGDKCEYYDYDILIKDNNGNFKFAGFIQWDENEMGEFDFGLNWCWQKTMIIRCLFYPMGVTVLRKYITKILRERIRRKQTKNIPYPPLK